MKPLLLNITFFKVNKNKARFFFQVVFQISSLKMHFNYLIYLHTMFLICNNILLMRTSANSNYPFIYSIEFIQIKNFKITTSYSFQFTIRSFYVYFCIKNVRSHNFTFRVLRFQQILTIILQFTFSHVMCRFLALSSLFIK